MLEYGVLAVSTLVLARGLFTFVSLICSLQWLRRNSFALQGKSSKSEAEPRLHILIPVLREQKRIISTLEYLIEKCHTINSRILVIGTQREYSKPFEGPSTEEIVRAFIKKRDLGDKVSMLIYPKEDGIRAHQLNHALVHLQDDESFILTLDADSRPHPSTIKTFMSLLRRDPDSKVFQIPAVFLKNYQALRGCLLKASSILQTRWTLTHEIPRLRRHTDSFWPAWLKKLFYSHTVGHGLIIQLGLLKRMGGFPDSTVTEDLFLGYLLRTNGYEIKPMPVLELSDAPISINSLWKQKYVWFFGPLNTLTYLRHILETANERMSLRILTSSIMSVQQIVSATAWLVSGPCIALLVMTPLLIAETWIIIYAWVSILAYGPLQYLVVLLCFSELHRYAGKAVPKLPVAGVTSVTVFSVIAIVFNSLPPYHTLLSNLVGRITGRRPFKPKTDE